MKPVIDNLSQQHRQLFEEGRALLGLLDPERLAVDGAEVRRALARLSGVLRVHLLMEDRCFYPHLLVHRDPSLRALAHRFLDERADLEQRYGRYRRRWIAPAAVEGDPTAFVGETRTILGELAGRMQREDDQFHPEIVRRWGSPSPVAPR